MTLVTTRIHCGRKWSANSVDQCDAKRLTELQRLWLMMRISVPIVVRTYADKLVIRVFQWPKTRIDSVTADEPMIRAVG